MKKNNQTVFSWSELKQHPSSSILILGSREISVERIVQLTNQLSTHTNKKIVWGVLEEKYILGLENSLQFRCLDIKTLQTGLGLINNPEISILTYSQNNTPQIISQGNWSAVIGINGSWHRAFHYKEEYDILNKKKIPYKLVSSFVDEKEALEYEKKILANRKPLPVKIDEKCSEKKILELVKEVSRFSFDHTWQTGAVLAQDGKFLFAAYNKIVPFETFAMLHGSSKEKHLSPPQDLNYFDTNHAEVEIVLQALEKKLDLSDCSLYLNLMPCPICARMLARTKILEVVYQDEHSDGYGKDILEKAGKKVRNGLSY